MIQFNLLPDVKLEFVKARKAKHMVMSISVIVSIVAIFILLISFFFVNGVQKKSIRDLNGDIAKYTTKVKNTPNLNKILTIQNQINSLPNLEAQKPATQFLFKYLAQITPNPVTISQLSLSLSTNALAISGEAPTLAIVDQFVDTLKFSTYTIGNSTHTTDAFSNVVLLSFGLPAPNSGAISAGYTIDANFDPVIFNTDDGATVNVPNITSTRSETDQPPPLFDQPPISQSTQTTTQSMQSNTSP